MTFTRQTVAQAALLFTSLALAGTAWTCPVDQARPFSAGPLNTAPLSLTPLSWDGPFSAWVTDSNGIGLTICNDSVTKDGNPPPCFFDPTHPANAYTRSMTRGAEGFYFLANSVFTTTDATGAQALDAVLVMGVESAFLSDPPAPGFETQFQRLRTRINVAKTGIYTVDSPWGTRNYTVNTLLPAGNGQNRMEISEPIDITFAPGSNAGLVTPFLIANNRGSVDPAKYIGDGLTLTTVTGSPCGQNNVTVTAYALDGTTPIDIGGNVRNAAGQIQKHVYRQDQFTVMGKLSPSAATPLSVSSTTYSRSAGVLRVNVMAEGSASRDATATVDVPTGLSGPTTVRMQHDGNRFFASVPVAQVPSSVTVTAADVVRQTATNVQTNRVTDLVSISMANASCIGTAPNRSCALNVEARSSDDTSPELTVVETGTLLTLGKAQFNGSAVPATVTVKSANGGVSTKTVTFLN